VRKEIIVEDPELDDGRGKNNSTRSSLNLQWKKGRGESICWLLGLDESHTEVNYRPAKEGDIPSISRVFSEARDDLYRQRGFLDKPPTNPLPPPPIFAFLMRKTPDAFWVAEKEDRDIINKGLQSRLADEVAPWGIEIVRAEIKDILPPSDIQESMKEILMSENDKKAAINIAEALANTVEGQKQAQIKQAEGLKQKLILEAEGERQSLITSAEGKRQAAITIAQGQAQAIQLVNEATNKYFVGNAITLKALETIATALSQNKIFFVPADKDLTLILSELGQNFIPMKDGKIEDRTVAIALDETGRATAAVASSTTAQLPSRNQSDFSDSMGNR